LFIILSGFWLSRTGKPYSVLIQTIHKLVGVAMGVYLIRMVYLTHQTSPLNPVGTLVSVVTVLLFLGLVATGGILATEKSMPIVVTAIHKVLPYLTALSTGAVLFLI
jgi:heme A synthase